MNIIPDFIRNRDKEWKAKIILPLLKDKETILDFGAGDMALSYLISQRLKDVSITGVDVIQSKLLKKAKNISFVKYDGEKLPFKNNSFDVVIAFYVLHHCFSVDAVISEITRVAKKRIVIVESVPYSPLEIPFMRFFDWFFNIVKLENVPLPFNFFTVSKWNEKFKKNGFTVGSNYHPRGREDILPFGKLHVLEYIKN